MADRKPKGDSKTRGEVKVKNEVKPKAETKVKPEVKSKTEVKPKVEAKPKAEVKQKTEVKPKSEAKPKAEVKVKAEAKPKPDVKPKVEVITEILTPSTSASKRTDLLLPQAKVKTIMKSSPEVEQIASETLYLITKATELFVDYLARQALDSSKGKSLTYKNLADYINKHENMAFLKDIVPPTMTAKAALVEVAKQNALINKDILE